MIEKGFWHGSTTLVSGPSGSGKTILGIQFVREGVLNKESSVYVGFEENPIQFARLVKSFGWNPFENSNGNHFEFMYRSPVEMEIDSVAAELFARVRSGQVKRVVIDSIGDLRKASAEPERFSDFIYSLTQWFATENVTCLLLHELPSLFDVSYISQEEVSNMSDNIVLLRFSNDTEMERTVRIIKTRGSAHDQREHILRISGDGVTVERAGHKS
jgi:circadian clock protein KaiC